MFYVGIDIGSTASKATVFKEDKMLENFIFPTGWSSVETSGIIMDRLKLMGITPETSRIVATGYGRVSVPYANKTVTEITCHGKGSYYLSGRDLTVIDIGGQDTKIITLEGGNVTNFIMNDKCAAGTGRFLELMANTLGVTIEKLTKLAEGGRDINISSMCTVFAESEVISLIGKGTSREDIAAGILNSITSKVKSLCHRHGSGGKYFLTGGLSGNVFILRKLSEKLGSEVETSQYARYAGSIGAAILAKSIR